MDDYGMKKEMFDMPDASQPLQQIPVCAAGS